MLLSLHRTFVRRNHSLQEPAARMVESVDTRDLKSLGHCGCVGSSPTPSTLAGTSTVKSLAFYYDASWAIALLYASLCTEKNIIHYKIY